MNDKLYKYRIDSDLRQGYIISPLLFNVYIDAVMKEVEIVIGRMGVRFLEIVSCMQMTWFYVVSWNKT